MKHDLTVVFSPQKGGRKKGVIFYVDTVYMSCYWLTATVQLNLPIFNILSARCRMLAIKILLQCNDQLKFLFIALFGKHYKESLHHGENKTFTSYLFHNYAICPV